MEVSEELMLTWGSHQQTLVNELAQLRHQGYFADVTLACEGRLYLAHKFILAMCSDYFRSIFGPSGVGGSNSSLVVVLKDVTCHDVEHLLDYMYTGVVSVQKSGLHSLIRTAENLQIKGLAFADSPDVPPAPSPERADGSFVSGPSRQEEAVTEELSPGNSRRVNTMGPDVRLNRVGPIASRVPVNSREGISPPSKRKRLQDSVGQSVMNPSNTSSTYTNNVRTSSSSSQPQMYSSKRRVSSPGGQSSFSSSSPTDAPAMPLFTEPQSPLLPPGSPLQYRHSGGPVPVSLANKSFRDSPDRGPGSSSSLEHLLPVSCSAPSAVTSPPLPVSGPGGHCPKGRGGEQEDAVQRPENLEIKKEEPDGDPPPTGVATEILLSVDSGGPSTEASELKEEPPPEEGESGPSGLHAGLECWGAAGAEGGLLADATEEDDVSDTDGAGVCWTEAQDKRYRCEWCGKNFRLSVHLKDHIRTHTGEKPYHCLICKKNFTQRSNLRTHLAKIHNEQLAYVKTRRRAHVPSSGVMMTATSAFSDTQLSQAPPATTSTNLSYKGASTMRQLSEQGGEGSSSVDTVNAADIGIDSSVTMRITSSMNPGKATPAPSRKRVWSASEEGDGAAASSGTTVVPYLSKETLSYLYSPTDAHFLQVAKLGPGGGEGFDCGAAESAGVGGSSVAAAGTPLSPSASRGGPGTPSAATPLNPVPLTPDPLLKTLLLKGGNQPNNLVTFDVSSSPSPSSDKSQRSLIYTSSASGTSLPNNTIATESTGNSQVCLTTAMSASQSPSPGKLVSTVKAGPSLATVSSVDDATISATFTFHPSNQLSLPTNLGVAASPKDLAKSVTLMDVANKGSSTLLKLPSFMVIEASGIAPQSSSQITVPASAPSSSEEPQQHNMEILLQAIDMKETSPTMPGKSASSQSVPTAVSSHLPHLTLNLQSLQSSPNVQLAARLPGSPSRPNTIHKSGSTMSPASPMPVSLNSSLFSSFAIQRPPGTNSYSSSPPILASSVLSHLPASLSMSSAAAISLPVYSLSPSCSTSNSSGLPLLTTVAPHVLTSTGNTMVNNSSAATVLLSSPTVVSSPVLTLPPGSSVLQQHHSGGGGGSGECMQRRTQIFREVDASGNSVTTSATLGCGPIVFTTPSHDGKTVTAPAMPDKVTVNIGGQEMTVHSSGSKPVLLEGRPKDKKVLAAMSDAMGVARFTGHQQTVASCASVQQGGSVGDVAQNGSTSLQGVNRGVTPFTGAAVTYQQLQPGGVMSQRVLIQPQHKQQQIKKHPQNLHQPPAPQQVKQIQPGVRPVVQHAYQPITTPHQTQQSSTSVHQLQQQQQQQRATVVSLQHQHPSPQQQQFSTLTQEQLKRMQQQVVQQQQQQLGPTRVFGNQVEAYHGVPISLVKETAVPEYGVQGVAGTSNRVTNSNAPVTSAATADGGTASDQATAELPSQRTN